jgi:hypothetical protein
VGSCARDAGLDASELPDNERVVLEQALDSRPVLRALFVQCGMT